MDFKEISDLGLVTGLMTLGYKPRERRKEGKRVTFVFDTDDHFESLCKDYFNNRMEVDAHTYNTTLKAVKSSIFQMQ